MPLYEVGDAILAVRDIHGRTPYQANSCACGVGSTYFIIKIVDGNLQVGRSAGGPVMTSGSLRMSNASLHPDYQKKMKEVSIPYKQQGVVHGHLQCG